MTVSERRTPSPSHPFFNPFSFREGMFPRPGDSTLLIEAGKNSLRFLPEEEGEYRLPEFDEEHSGIYLPKGSTGLLLVGVDEEPILLKHFKRGEPEVFAFYDGYVRRRDGQIFMFPSDEMRFDRGRTVGRIMGLRIQCKFFQ